MVKASLISCFVGYILCYCTVYRGIAQTSDTLLRKEYLKELREFNRPHPTPSERPRDVFASFVRLSFKDSTWGAWQKRTGELPPDFDALPDIPLLPNPLIWDEGVSNQPITTFTQWEKQRNWIKENAIKLLSGTFPPAPDNLKAEIMKVHFEGDTKVQTILLTFGPEQKARLTLEVYTPKGKGPHPVFMSQWNHRGWVQIAVRRGYMGVIYAGADVFDETIDYQEIYPDYDWSALMTRAWGAQRAMDYLYTLPEVDRDKIALTGHSRNAKLSLFAGAYDPRFTAIISSSGGTGGEIPYRFTDEIHENEPIDYLNAVRPQWFHPRLRFYNGREHKLPIDQNSLMALIAPNALLLSSSIREVGGGDPWAIEQNYTSLKEVYSFMGVPEKVSLRFRDGKHAVEARDIESFVDWLDIQFGRSNKTWPNERYYPYNFDIWKKRNPLSGDEIPQPIVLAESIEKLAVSDQKDLNQLKSEIRERINWTLGEKPQGIKASPILSLTNKVDYMDLILDRPTVSNGTRKNIAPYNALGDYLHGALYIPSGIAENGQNKIPVVVLLHKYTNTGFDTKMTYFIRQSLEKGIAVFTMDLLGYGSRIEEGTSFYERYPAWSKMGKMVTDTQAAIAALGEIDFIDKSQIYLSGYALGGTVALFTAALQEDIAGIAVASAFTPLRTAGKEMEGIHTYSHLYGLVPRWGYFIDEPDKIPVDFPEIMAAISPAPLMVISPEKDRHASINKVTKTMDILENLSSKAYSESNVQQQIPKGFNRFDEAMQDKIISWIKEKTLKNHL
jgi:dienelactone hydrolase